MQTIAQRIYADMRRRGEFSRPPLYRCIRAVEWAAWSDNLIAKLREERA